MPLIEKRSEAKVVGLVLSADRMKKGPGGNNALAELRREFNIETTSIISFFKLVEYLESGARDAVLAAAGILRRELLEAMQAYHRQFGAKPLIPNTHPRPSKRCGPPR